MIPCSLTNAKETNAKKKKKERNMAIRVTSLCQVECIPIILDFITNAENPVEEAVLQGIHVDIRSFDHFFL